MSTTTPRPKLKPRQPPQTQPGPQALPLHSDALAALTDGWHERRDSGLCGWFKDVGGLTLRIYPTAITWRMQGKDESGAVIFDRCLKPASADDWPGWFSHYIQTGKDSQSSQDEPP